MWNRRTEAVGDGLRPALCLQSGFYRFLSGERRARASPFLILLSILMTFIIWGVSYRESLSVNLPPQAYSKCLGPLKCTNIAL